MKRKRSAPKYWVEINGRLYARLQYKNEFGKYRTKYKPLSNKRLARGVVEKMRQELDLHGEEIFKAERLTFGELVDRYESAELVEATYQAGVKIGGRRSIGAAISAIKPLREYFGRKRIRAIKPFDLRNYKNDRISTPVRTEVNEKTKVIDAQTGKETTQIKKVIRTRERRIAMVNR
jgi:hypothetical protein